MLLSPLSSLCQRCGDLDVFGKVSLLPSQLLQLAGAQLRTRQSWSPRRVIQNNIIEQRPVLSLFQLEEDKLFYQMFGWDVKQWSRPQSLLEFLKSEYSWWLILQELGVSGMIELGQMTDRAEVEDIITQSQPPPSPLTLENNIILLWRSRSKGGEQRGKLYFPLTSPNNYYKSETRLCSPLSLYKYYNNAAASSALTSTWEFCSGKAPT